MAELARFELCAQCVSHALLTDYIRKCCLLYTSFFALDRLSGVLQLAVALSLPLLACYNGQRGKNARVNKFLKWFFYLYYPQIGRAHV